MRKATDNPGTTCRTKSNCIAVGFSHGFAIRFCGSKTYRPVRWIRGVCFGWAIPTEWFRLRACLKIPRGAVFGEKTGRRGATKEHTPCGSGTEVQRSQPAFSAKTLRAAGLLALSGVGSVVTARSGDTGARAEVPSPPWPEPKSPAAAPFAILR